MFVKILASISAEVVQVDHIRMMPRWMLGGRIVLIGSYHSAEEHDQHVARTVGSTDWLWSGSDELRFDPKTLLLESAQLRVPDSHLGSGLSLVPWQAAQRVDGIIRLMESQNFHLSPADFRWMDPHGETLICLSEGAWDTAQSRLRLRIAQNLELFFTDERMCGWSLFHPAQYLVNAWEEPFTKEEGDSQLAALLHDYLTLVTDPYVKLMEEGDPKLREALLDLSTRIISAPRSSAQHKVLYNAVGNALELFYDQQMSNE